MPSFKAGKRAKMQFSYFRGRQHDAQKPRTYYQPFPLFLKITPAGPGRPSLEKRSTCLGSATRPPVICLLSEEIRVRQSFVSFWTSLGRWGFRSARCALEVGDEPRCSSAELCRQSVAFGTWLWPAQSHLHLFVMGPSTMVVLKGSQRNPTKLGGVLLQKDKPPMSARTSLCKLSVSH